jgi:hypothetical protein
LRPAAWRGLERRAEPSPRRLNVAATGLDRRIDSSRIAACWRVDFRSAGRNPVSESISPSSLPFKTIDDAHGGWRFLSVSTP